MSTNTANAARPAVGADTEKSVAGFGLIVAQLLLMNLVLHQVDMLPPAFRRVVWLATGGFVLHHLLPIRFRLPAFVTLSLVGLALVLGTPNVPDAFWQPVPGLVRATLIVACGALLIGVCLLPVGFWTRAGLLACAGLVVAGFRSNLLPASGLEVVWLVLASMFMFRLVVFLYDLSTTKKRPTLWQACAYFFPLPNVCSMLFPVIDFKTMCRTYYNEDALVIYQRGVHWMSRGIVQLLAYRYIEQLFTIPATGVYSGKSLLAYLVTNSFLYLNVSGQFHFIVGLLLLFGFNLPETNRRYFLAESFTDYWRRVNIYWKDFMLKVFYYPTFFRFRRFGDTTALVLATSWVFVVTWALHLYQTWWLKGSTTVTWPDVLFWSILGLLILANSLYEMKWSRTNPRTQSTYSTRAALWLGVRTAGTFGVICLLWSLWSSPTLTNWLEMWRFFDAYTLFGGFAVLAGIMIAKLAIEVLPARWQRAKPRTAASSAGPWWRGPAQAAVPLLATYAFAYLAINSYLPNVRFPEIDERLEARRLYDVLEAGDSMPPASGGQELTYYQQLTGMDEGNRQLLEALKGQRIPPRFSGYMPITNVEDFRLWEFKPNVRAVAFETDFATNRYGMRDLEYAAAKRNGTTRIALLGSSHVMGWGVELQEMFDSVLESQLNAAFGHGGAVEVLNFAVYGYSPLAQVSVLETRASRFQPDIVLLIGHLPDYKFVNYALRVVQKRQLPIQEEYLRRVLEDARVYPHLHEGLAEKRLQPFEDELMSWSLRQVAAKAREIGAQPLYAFLPTPAELPLSARDRERAQRLLRTAAEAGFRVFDLTTIFDGHRPRDLLTGISPHSNPVAHKLIADSLYQHLMAGNGPLADRYRRASVSQLARKKESQ